MLDELKASLSEKLIDFSYNEDVCKYLAEKCGNGKRGARELRNIIRRNIENRIVDIIIDGGEGGVKLIAATAPDGEIKLDVK